MIRAVDRKYCNNDCVQIMTDKGICNLVIDDNEILYLRNGNKVLAQSPEAGERIAENSTIRLLLSDWHMLCKVKIYLKIIKIFMI